MKPEKKLFTLSISVGMMVWAEDEDEARELGEMYLSEEIEHNPPDRMEYTVSESLTCSKKRVFADGWKDDDYPYANDNDDEESVGDRFRELEKR
jgi:hypothetical protein